MRENKFGRRGKASAFSLVELLVVMVILVVMTAMIIPAIMSFRKKAEEAQTGLETAEPVTQTTQSNEVVTSTDLTVLWVILGSLGGLALLVGIGVGTYMAVSRARASRRTLRDAVAARTLRLESLRARHSSLNAEYGAYLLSMEEVLHRPLLSDVSEPLTATFIEAHATLEALIEGSDEETLARYEALLTNAWDAWRRASSNATKKGIGSFTSDEQRRIRQAVSLLRLAENDGASEFERASALAQAKKLVDGLVVIPRQASAAIETKVRAAITA